MNTILLTSSFLTFVVFCLVFWDIYSKWKKVQLELNLNSIDIGTSNIPSPGFELMDAYQKPHNLNNIVKSGIVLVFVDAQCTHCENNLEEFIHRVGVKNQKNFAVICGENNLDLCKKISELYDNKFLVLQGSNQLFAEFEVPFLPAFYHIDKQLIIREKTPIPYKVISM